MCSINLQKKDLEDSPAWTLLPEEVSCGIECITSTVLLFEGKIFQLIQQIGFF